MRSAGVSGVHCRQVGKWLRRRVELEDAPQQLSLLLLSHVLRIHEVHAGEVVDVVREQAVVQRVFDAVANAQHFELADGDRFAVRGSSSRGRDRRDRLAQTLEEPR